MAYQLVFRGNGPINVKFTTSISPGTFNLTFQNGQTRLNSVPALVGTRKISARGSSLTVSTTIDPASLYNPTRFFLVF